jgi:hypothetical protein
MKAMRGFIWSPPKPNPTIARPGDAAKSSQGSKEGLLFLKKKKQKDFYPFAGMR